MASKGAFSLMADQNVQAQPPTAVQGGQVGQPQALPAAHAALAAGPQGPPAGGAVDPPQFLSKTELIRVMGHVAPKPFSGEPGKLGQFFLEVKRLQDMRLCQNEQDLLMVVTSAFQGTAVAWYQAWQLSTPEPSWRRLKEDLSGRFMGEAFRLRAVRNFLELRATGNVGDFVLRFRAAIDEMRLADHVLPEDFLRASFLTKLHSEDAKRMPTEDLSLEKTLQAAERLGAAHPPQRPTWQRPSEAERASPGTKWKSTEPHGAAGEPKRRSGPDTGFRGACYICKRTGHRQADCPEAGATTQTANPGKKDE